MTHKLSIDEFSMERQLPSTGVIVVSGTTGSGKSTILEELLYFYRNTLDFVVAFIGSEETAEELQKNMPSTSIHDQWRPFILEKIVREQERNENNDAEYPRLGSSLIT